MTRPRTVENGEKANHMLDASALLTVLLREPGEARVVEVLEYAQMHAVNIAEVVARLVRSDVPVADAI